MIKPTDLPHFQKGERPSAKKFNKMSDAITQTMAPGMFAMPGMTLQRPQGGGGGGSVTAFAVVIVQADADGGSVGKAVLLDEDMRPIDGDDAPLVIDPGDPDYDSGAVGDADIEFKSADFCDLPVGWRVRLWSKNPLKAGSTWDDDHKVWGNGVLPPCQSKEFVTDVACNESNEIEGNTDNADYLECLDDRPLPSPAPPPE